MRKNQGMCPKKSCLSFKRLANRTLGQFVYPLHFFTQTLFNPQVTKSSPALVKLSRCDQLTHKQPIPRLTARADQK